MIVNRKGLWDTLRVYGVGDNLFEGINLSPSVRMQVPMCG